MFPHLCLTFHHQTVGAALQGGQDSVTGGHFLLSPALHTLQMGFKPSQSPWSGERSLSQCTVCCQPDWAIKTWGRLPHRFCDIPSTVRPDCNPHQPPAKCHHPGTDEAASAPQGKHKPRGHRRSVGSGPQPEVLGPDTQELPVQRSRSTDASSIQNL